MRLLFAPFLLAALASSAPPAQAQDSCRVVDFSFTPSEKLQIVVWIEDAEGNFIDTAFITQKTGSFGLGNRPGIMEFNSAPMWCYGRRETTFPIWAHRHGLSWPKVVFQDGDDDDLSHPIAQSSIESTYCRPLDPESDRDQNMWDAETCATTAYTDKGVYHESEQSLYPPRSDFSFDSNRDTADAMDMLGQTTFDAVSRPTPIGGENYSVVWPIPEGMEEGQYTAFIEVSKEFDQNDTYDYPSPSPISWSQYGVAYRGQPSVLYRVDFAVGADEGPAFSSEYIGYGDPEGKDGVVRPPDATITTGVAGSGAGRLLIAPSEEGYRIRVESKSSDDREAPGTVGDLTPLDASPSSFSFEFTETGDDGDQGRASSYEVRYVAGGVLDEENWNDAAIAPVQIQPGGAGTEQLLTIEGLLPNTSYTVGLRAKDECLNEGEIRSLSFVTPRPLPGEVDACFVATAAYGSLMATEVVALRDFRDRFLRTHVPGELFVEAYYSFGPALSKLVDGSPLWRRTARAFLSPLVEKATHLAR